MYAEHSHRYTATLSAHLLVIAKGRSDRDWREPDAFRGEPQFNKKFCDKCGKATLSAYPHCKDPIRGDYWGGGILVAIYSPPDHCHGCGKPFPWTERRIQAAINLAIEGGYFNEEEKSRIASSMWDVTRDTPTTGLAATRLQKLMVRVSKGAAEMVRDVLVNIVSETVKKVLFPDAPPTPRR